MAAIENNLVAQSQIQNSAGHSLHKGTPRETFIREFLISHLPENVAIGSGEIIDANSQPGGSRNQFDIVIYKKNYPKLDFGGNVSGFLIESVIATIEVKSTLTSADLEQAIGAAQKAKNLKTNTINSFHSGYIPPKILNYVVAYKGPANIETAYNWIQPIQTKLGITSPSLPQDQENRLKTPSSSIDGIFILNSGFIYFDNTHIGFANSSTRNSNPNGKWIYVDIQTGSLLFLFLLLQSATANIEGKWLDTTAYLTSFSVPSFMIGDA